MYHFYGCSFSYAAQWSCMARCSLMERRRKSRTSTYCLYIWAITRGLSDFFYIRCNFYLYKVKPGTESLSQAFSFSLSQFCQLQRKRFCLLQTSFSLYMYNNGERALMVLCSVWPYSQKLTTIQCSQGKALSTKLTLGSGSHLLWGHLYHTPLANLVNKVVWKSTFMFQFLKRYYNFLVTLISVGKILQCPLIVAHSLVLKMKTQFYPSTLWWGEASPCEATPKQTQVDLTVVYTVLYHLCIFGFRFSKSWKRACNNFKDSGWRADTKYWKITKLNVNFFFERLRNWRLLTTNGILWADKEYVINFYVNNNELGKFIDAKIPNTEWHGCVSTEIALNLKLLKS